MSTPLTPNNSHWPSMEMNTPQLWPFINAAPGTPVDFGEVPEKTSFETPLGHPYPPQGPNTMLAEMREKFPFVPVMPFPNWYKTIFLGPSAPKDIEIPTGVVMLQMRGSASYLCSAKGKAQLPTITDSDESFSMWMPDGIPFYCGNIKSLSFIAVNNGTLVTVWGHRFEEMPTYA